MHCWSYWNAIVWEFHIPRSHFGNWFQWFCINTNFPRIYLMKINRSLITALYHTRPPICIFNPFSFSNIIMQTILHGFIVETIISAFQARNPTRIYCIAFAFQWNNVFNLMRYAHVCIYENPLLTSRRKEYRILGCTFDWTYIGNTFSMLFDVHCWELVRLRLPMQESKCIIFRMIALTLATAEEQPDSQSTNQPSQSTNNPLTCIAQFSKESLQPIRGRKCSQLMQTTTVFVLFWR